MQPHHIFFLFFGFIVAKIAWRYFRTGSFTGAMLGGEIKREIGQVLLANGSLSSQNLKIHAMESSDGESFVGIALVSKAPLAASMIPIKLSQAQAQELARMLQQAASAVD